MTEGEWWDASTDPAAMLALLAGRATDRQRRLFAVACCRRLAPLPDDGLVRSALDVAERYADGQATDDDRRAARTAAQRAAQGRGVTRQPTASKWERRAASAAYYATARTASEAAGNAGQLVVESLVWRAGGYGRCDAAAIEGEEHRQQADLVRCVFGNPFRPAAIDPAWVTSTVATLAAGIDAERAFDRLPALADALEDAGCDDRDLLGHLRGDGPHVRGCWALDLTATIGLLSFPAYSFFAWFGVRPFTDGVSAFIRMTTQSR